MRHFEITWEGTTPLLMHKPSDLAMSRATSGANSGLGGDKGETPRALAEQCLYRSAVDDERIVIPQPNLFRCLIDAGKFLKVGKSKLTTQKNSLVPAAIDISGIEAEVFYRQPWAVDVRSVVIPSTGGRINRYRPRFDDWRLELDVALDETVFNERMFRELVDMAGSRIGLGDFRPDRKGPFGKFKVTRWIEIEIEQVA